MPESTTAPPTEQDTRERIVAGESDADDATRAEQAVARANAEGIDRGDWSLPARQMVDPAQLEVLRATVAKDCNKIELAMFLEVASRYRLDPFLKEIYAAKFDGASGGVTIFTGRDGLLKAARMTGRFVRVESAVVRANDEFEVVLDLDPDHSPELARVKRLHHKRKGMGSESRGAIVGAYALVYRAGDPEPWYAEASWEDYGANRQKDGNNKPTTWTLDSKKGFPEAMMRKVPESIALRMAFGIAGIVGAEELGDTPERVQNLSDPGGADGVAAKPVTVEYGDDDLGRELRELVTLANELLPTSWRDAKVAMRINGKPTEQRLKLRDTLRRFVGNRKGGTERLAGVVRAEEPVQEAVVVDETPTPVQEAAKAPEGAEEGEEVTGTVEPDPTPEGPVLPVYNAELHSSMVDTVTELRVIVEETEVGSQEQAEASADLRMAEESLELMNRAAEVAGHERVDA